MRRFAENVIFQKFRRHQVNERYETTTTTRGGAGQQHQQAGSAEPVEYINSSRDEYTSEEHYYTTGNAPDATGQLKKLHYTQSLQDAFNPPPAGFTDIQFAKEFPPLQREPTKFSGGRNIGERGQLIRHQQQAEQAETANQSKTPSVETIRKQPMMREEQKYETSEEDRGENFLRRQQYKLYQLREETIRKFGRAIGPGPNHGEYQQQQAEERRARIHGSLPPLGRHRQQQQHHHPNISQLPVAHQLPFELIIDRCPPQLVQSTVSPQQLSDDPKSNPRETRGQSCGGFSPFPVFGPFSVSAATTTHGGSKPNLQNWSSQHHPQQQKQSREEHYENGPAVTMMTTSTGPEATTTTTSWLTTSQTQMQSSDEWQSAYEYLPSFHQQQLQRPQQQPRQLAHEEPNISSLPFPNNKSTAAGAEPHEQNIRHTFHLYKFGSDPEAVADHDVVKFMATASARAQFKAVAAAPLVMENQRIQQLKQQQQKPIETSMTTFSEKEANEEVRTFMRGGTQSLNTSMAKSMETSGATVGGGCFESSPRELAGLPDRVHYHGQPIRVEISGPVHFLHATNMNVHHGSTAGQQQGTMALPPTTCDVSDKPVGPSDSVQTSMNSNVGIPLISPPPESPGKEQQQQIQQQQNVTWSTTTKSNEKIVDGTGQDLRDNEERARIRANQVISPPVERYIESVCDLQPIMAEIGEALKQQGQIFSPAGDERGTTIRRRYEKETRREEHFRQREEETTFNYNLADKEKAEAPKLVLRGSQSAPHMPPATSGTSASKEEAKRRRPSMGDAKPWSPYLVESTSHCHLARVAEISQEWRIEQKPSFSTKMAQEAASELRCSCAVTPKYNREYARERLWTMAIPIVKPELKSSTKIDEKSLPVQRQWTNLEEEEERHYIRQHGRSQEQEKQREQPVTNQEQEHHHLLHYSTLQTPNRSRKSGQQEYEQKIHKTRSFDQEDLLPRLIDHEQYEQLKRTLNEVQRDLDNAEEYTRQSRSVEVERIERAILAISQRLQRPLHEPVSRAHAEAKEELLRVRLAQMILNLNPDFDESKQEEEEENLLFLDEQFDEQQGGSRRSSKRRRKTSADASSAEMSLDNYYGQALRAPIGLLREKLALLERRLLEEQQQEVRDQLRQINATPPLLRTDQQRQSQQKLNKRDDEIARMTPLLGMLRHKLFALDQQCQREQQKVAAVSSGSGRLTPYEERKTVHELLVRINNEIETIHELCRKEDVKDRLDTVLAVLKKVAVSIDQIVETLDTISASFQQSSSQSEVPGAKAIVERNGSDGQTEPHQQQQQQGMAKLEQAIQHRESIQQQKQQQQVKRRAQQMGKKEMLLGVGAPSNAMSTAHRRSRSPVDIERYSNEPRPMEPQPREVLNQTFAFHHHQQQQHPQKKVPPQVPPKRKSLTGSIEEQQQQRLGPLYCIVEEKEQPNSRSAGNGQQQRVNAVELSAHLARPVQSGSRVNALIPLLTINNSPRLNSPPMSPPTIGQQMDNRGDSDLVSSNNNNNQKSSNSQQKRSKVVSHHSQTPPPPPRIVRQHQMGSLDEKTVAAEGPLPVRLGPCPISYLERDHQQQQQRRLQAHQPQFQNSIWSSNNSPTMRGPASLQPPPPAAARSQQQQKLLQLRQQHYFCSSLEDDEEDTVSASVASMDSSSLSVPILFRKKSSVSSAPPGGALQHETAILTDEEIDHEENCTETFVLRRRRKHAILNAVIYPEQRARVTASFSGENFQVDVERMTECGRDSVVMVSEEFFNKRVLIRSGSPVRKSTIMEELDRESSEEGNSSPGFVDAHTRMAVSINAKSDYDSVHVFLEEIPWGQIGLDVKTPTPMVSPTATSNSVRSPAFLDPDDGQRSARSFGGMASSMESALTGGGGTGGRDSVLKQISVSEGPAGQGDELSGRLSLRSASRRSSQKSLAQSSERSWATTFLIGGQEEELEDIPAYVIKTGSTASITCELNSECVSDGTKIEWFRGQNEQILPMGGKFERHSHLGEEPAGGDLVEMLVIFDVRPEDGQLYSVKVGGELFPVAYLIIEDLEEGSGTATAGTTDMETSTPSAQTVVVGTEPQFLTQPQTQFVMQGETAIISMSMNRANLNLIWSKDGQPLDSQSGGMASDGRPRLWFESTTTGWYRVIVNEVQFADQGFYYAQIGEKFTSIQLIVEDRIDEREVQVSSAETDDEELGDYLVPIGSTATIACELENVSFGYRLHWQRNHEDLDPRIASADGKFEHVLNGTKHYLIIHCAQPCDSGVYSVRIGDAQFKVAQITIGNEPARLSGSTGGSSGRIKRISSQSLNKLEEKGGGETSEKRKTKKF